MALAALSQHRELARRVATAQRWGLAQAPRVPPLPPVVKPVLKTEKGWETNTGGPGLPPVITRVPTKDKVIFLTVDDGTYKDPRLIGMARDLGIPYSAFLTDQEAGDDYGYFRRMHRAGVSINSHTLTHPYLRAMSYERQYHEICGQQRILSKAIGTRPRLFRPPYGAYNGDTLLAAKHCGVEVVPLWQEEVFPDHWEFRSEGHHLRPGDIVLTHFRGREQWKGTMPDVIREVLRRAAAEGYAIARLEDYV
jgi:peptidoglycan/xylan/chitin deacetylase (PgdA/CDA1 family)